MSKRHGSGRKAGSVTRGKRERHACRCPVSVDSEQRQHLIDCIAFFRAGSFRDALPGNYRKEDLREAATEVDAVLQVQERAEPAGIHTPARGRSGARIRERSR